MKTKLNLLISFLCLVVMYPVLAQEHEIPKLENPISIQYLKKNLRKSQPRLVLNSGIEKDLKKKVKSDPVVKNMYEAVKLNAAGIYGEPLLERKLQGRRLLGVSREMLWRMNMLGMVYRMEKGKKALDRINDEVIAVCKFTDWNPSHFLDVAEMSMAVAFALDWTAGKLPKSTVEMAKNALIEKGIKPSWPENGRNPGWAYGTNNWNQVYNGGMIAASIAVAEIEPELAAKTIYRAIDGMTHALSNMAPMVFTLKGQLIGGMEPAFLLLLPLCLKVHSEPILVWLIILLSRKVPFLGNLVMPLRVGITILPIVAIDEVKAGI